MEVYHITLRRDIKTLEELFDHLASNFAKHLISEAMKTTVLKSFERMRNPTEASKQNFANEVTKEIEKVMIFQSVIDNCMTLRQYFEKKFEGHPQKLTNF